MALVHMGASMIGEMGGARRKGGGGEKEWGAYLVKTDEMGVR